MPLRAPHLRADDVFGQRKDGGVRMSGVCTSGCGRERGYVRTRVHASGGVRARGAAQEQGMVQVYPWRDDTPALVYGYRDTIDTIYLLNMTRSCTL